MSMFFKRFGKFMRENRSKFVKPYHNKEQTDDDKACFNCDKKVILLHIAIGPRKMRKIPMREQGLRMTKIHSRRKETKKYLLLRRAQSNGLIRTQF